jgi:mannosyl-3-phosphoglycerate phosphatase
LNNKEIKTVVFADLDGSLLDNLYGYAAVQPIIREFSALGAAVVFCSSKTRSEMLFYQKSLRINEPFIVENGSAIFVPKGYFLSGCVSTKQIGKHDVIELGVPYWMIRQKLSRVRSKTNAHIIGFGDLTAKKISMDAGLPLHLAKLAKQREYDEPFRVVKGSEEKVLSAIEKLGLNCTEGGRYLHVLGDTDKGKAAVALTELFIQEFGEVLTVGVGDSANDLPMLEQVDAAFFVKKGTGEKGIVEAWRKILAFATQSARIKPMTTPLTATLNVSQNSQG